MRTQRKQKQKILSQVKKMERGEDMMVMREEMISKLEEMKNR